MVIPHSGGYPHAKFEGNLLLFKFEPHTKSGLTIPQCVRVGRAKLQDSLLHSWHLQCAEEKKDLVLPEMASAQYKLTAVW